MLTYSALLGGAVAADTLGTMGVPLDFAGLPVFPVSNDDYRINAKIEDSFGKGLLMKIAIDNGEG